MKKVHVSFDVDIKKLATIMEVLSDVVENFKTNEVDKPHVNGAKAKPTTDKRRWAMRVGLKVLQAMDPGKEYSYKDPDLQKICIDNNYAASSLNSVLSALLSKDRVTRVAPGIYVRK